MVHRLGYTLVANGLFALPTISIQMMMLFNLFFDMFLFSSKPAVSRNEVAIERLTNFLIHMNLLQLLLFTDFVTNEAAKTYYSVFYFAIMLVVFLVHSGFIFKTSTEKLIRIWKLKKLKQQEEKSYSELIQPKLKKMKKRRLKRKLKKPKT